MTAVMLVLAVSGYSASAATEAECLRNSETELSGTDMAGSGEQERKRSLGPYTMYEQIIYQAKQERIMEWLADDMSEGRATGTHAGMPAARFIEVLFRQYGLEPLFGSSFYQPFIADSLNGTIGRNVAGIVRSAVPSDEYVLISAHYDHLGILNGNTYNGADDNASGVTVLLNLVRLNQEKELLDTRMANADELLALMEKRFSEGGANVIEVNKVKMERMNVRTLAAQNEAARQNTLQTLRAMNGNIPVELLAAEYPAAAEVVNYDEFYAEVMATDAGILSAEASVDAAAQEIKVNKQNWLPKFEVGYRRNTAMKEASNGFLVGASLPLFSSRNKTKIAEARHTAAQSELENARLQAETQLQSRYNELQQIHSAVQTYDVPLMHSTLDALKSAVLAGQMSVIDYYVEADNVYGNISTYLLLENQYRKLLAEVYKNRL